MIAKGRREAALLLARRMLALAFRITRARCMFPPERIVCLTEETVETRRHPENRRQADIAATLIRHGVAVHAFNQRTIAQILDMIRTLGGLVGAADRADRLASELAAAIDDARTRAEQLSRRPRIYLEEWDDPMISGIGWVSELIEAAGGIDIFADRASCKSAKDRIVTAEEVIRHEPDIIVGSWCGKKFRPEKVASRPGFDRIAAVRHGALHEIKSPLILQPGPAALT